MKEAASGMQEQERQAAKSVPAERGTQAVRAAAEEPRCVDAEFVRRALPPRRADGQRGTFGKVLAVGGSVGYTGGAVPHGRGGGSLRVWPGVSGGAGGHLGGGGGQVHLGHGSLPDEDGMLSCGGLESLRQRLAACDVLALGPGLGRSAETQQLVLSLLETEKPVVLDADGINALAGHIDALDARRGRVTILTPHDGEFARVGGSVRAGETGYRRHAELCPGARMHAGAQGAPDGHRPRRRAAPW